MRRLVTLYLFADGHSVGIYSERHKSGAEVRWVEVDEHAGPAVDMHVPDEDRETWRIVFTGDVCGIIKKARHIEFWADNRVPERRTGNPQRAMYVSTKDGRFVLWDIEGVCHSDFYYQGAHENAYTTYAHDAAATYWGNDRLRVGAVRTVHA